MKNQGLQVKFYKKKKKKKTQFNGEKNLSDVICKIHITLIFLNVPLNLTGIAIKFFNSRE
jgi:hypothetical protein